jgi:hypothetical protein
VGCVGLQVPLIKLPLEECVGRENEWRPVPYPAPGCKDVSSDCRARAISGQCDTSRDMLTRCRRSCGVCRLVSSVPGCVDRDASCLVAASVQGRCQKDPVSMGPKGLGCLLSCGTCSAEPRWVQTHALHDVSADTWWVQTHALHDASADTWWVQTHALHYLLMPCITCSCAHLFPVTFWQCVHSGWLTPSKLVTWTIMACT